jgi:hypothetical protein
MSGQINEKNQWIKKWVQEYSLILVKRVKIKDSNPVHNPHPQRTGNEWDVNPFTRFYTVSNKYLSAS